MYYYYDRKQQFEEFARVQLLLYVPWRNEDELKGTFNSHAECYLTKEAQINDIRAFYHKIENEKLLDAMEECEKECDLSPGVDEEELIAEFVNERQNSKVDALVPPQIAQELGLD